MIIVVAAIIAVFARANVIDPIPSLEDPFPDPFE